MALTELGKVAWSSPEKGDPMKAKIPLGRFAGKFAIFLPSITQIALIAFSEPQEIADTIVFLLSDKSSMITGTVLPIDGGYTCV